jgi:hypothetical protein
MNDNQRGRAAAILAQQLPMNPRTLALLQEKGLKPETVVQLDFFFVAPNRERATALKLHLEDNDCLEMETHRRPGVFSKKFDVTGKSKPTTVDAEILDQWVQWMVVQGVLFDSDFDGWGTEVKA